MYLSPKNVSIFNFFFFFNDPATTEIYTLPLHDALPISPMSTGPSVNRRIVLGRRQQGAPSAQDFRLEAQPVPVPGAGQVLLRTRYLSLDPYMRGRMNEARSYVAPVAIGAPLVGQTVSLVQASNVSGFAAGDLVLANVGWQDYGLSDGSDLVRIDAAMPRPSYALGVLGMPGLMAYVRLPGI